MKTDFMAIQTSWKQFFTPETVLKWLLQQTKQLSQKEEKKKKKKILIFIETDRKVIFPFAVWLGDGTNFSFVPRGCLDPAWPSPVRYWKGAYDPTCSGSRILGLKFKCNFHVLLLSYCRHCCNANPTNEVYIITKKKKIVLNKVSLLSKLRLILN